MKENILITGYNGFVGHSISPLLSKKYNIIGIDDLSLSKKDLEINKYLLKNYYIDFVDKKIKKIIKKYNINTIIHLAACSTVSEGEKNPAKYWNNNVDKTRILFQYAGECDVKNIIFFSSASVYGNRNGLLNENLKPNPISIYAKTKLAVEKMAPEFNQRYGLNIIILRCFNIIGSKLIHENDTHILPKMISCINEGTCLYIRKNKNQKHTDLRDYIDVLEIEKFIELILEKYDKGELKNNLILNMGTGIGTSIKALLYKVNKVYNTKIHYEYINKNSSDPASSICDTTKCMKLFGECPKENINEVVEKIKRDNN